jgi:hypothetical protein
VPTVVSTVTARQVRLDGGGDEVAGETRVHGSSGDHRGGDQRRDDQAAQPERAGDVLRVALEAQGLTLADVAGRTRVPLRHLEAIDASDYAGLPSPTYAVGFGRAYARAIGADEVRIAQMVRDDVAKLEFHLGIGVIFAAGLHHVFVEAARFCRVGGELCKTVAAIDVHHHGHRAYAVCRVEIAIAMYGVVCAPLCFGESFFAKLGTGAAVFAVIELDVAQIMLIAALQVDDLAKHTLPHHIEHGHHVAAVAYVFELHQGHARTFRSMHQLPAFFYRHAGDYFAAYIFFGVHGIQTHYRMPFPRSRDNNGIDFLILQ